jgi:predicted transcriptional regulator YdeE
MSNVQNELRTEQFGPYRVIGMSYVGKNENGEIPALWGREGGFLARMGEIGADPDAPDIAFGICRCMDGVTGGSFEYIAGLPAKADAPVPDGMVEAGIAESTYAVFSVPNLAALHDAWNATGAWFEALPEWAMFCGPTAGGKCDCATHPCFELYPPGFTGEKELFIYIPIQRK